MPIYIYLFNKILDEGTIPEEWLIGIIMPIYKKKGCPREPGNYRGITLLSCMGKLFTSIINKRLSTFVETNNILNENQTAYRDGYCTSDHIYSLKCLIELICLRKQKLFTAMVDYKSAFDTIWRDGLWFKLQS